jgi:OFA family oxalate/formate antiporter-like MFS transporter
MLWAMLGLNVSAGLGLISQLSPIAQELYKPLVDPTVTGDALVKTLAWAGGLVVAVTAIFNGLGRLFWAKISDNIGRKAVFLTIFITQAILYLLIGMGLISNYWFFMIIGCYLLAGYGAGFATMPAFAADSFGPGYIGKVYGFMLTAWAVAGIVGPLVFAAIPKQALYVAAGLLLVGFFIALAYKPPAQKKV